MKLGLLTVPFGTRSLTDVAGWASLTTSRPWRWPPGPSGAGSDRRYASVTHIDVDTLTADEAGRIGDELGAQGIAISALGYYPNPLDPELVRAADARDQVKRVII